jgi:hypothetical protein
MLEAALFPRKSGPLVLDFLTFVLHFMLDPDPNPVLEPEPECITIEVPPRQKVAVPATPVFHNTAALLYLRTSGDEAGIADKDIDGGLSPHALPNLIIPRHQLERLRLLAPRLLARLVRRPVR